MKNLSRRSFFKNAGVGVASTTLATTAVANLCKNTTGAQSLGPFFPNPGTPVDEIKESADGSLPIYLANDNDLTYIKGRNGSASGQVAHVSGVLSDDNCLPIENATIIIWQASKTGRYNHKGDAVNQDFVHPKTGELMVRKLDPYFQSWGQTTTNQRGEYSFKTIVPGFYPANVEQGWYRPPHIHFMVSATGYPQLVTQMYFRGKDVEDNEYIQELNQQDLILQGQNLSEPQRQGLIVDFKKSFGVFPELQGEFDIKLTR